MSKSYYNEWESYPADWMESLMAEDLIMPGDIDRRSIRRVRYKEVIDYEQAHFFAGIGGWSYALRLAGWPDSAPVWTGSCPCQPLSTAGRGFDPDDERHLWPVWFRLIRKCRPPVIFGEQAARGAGKYWLTAVRADLETADYAFGAASLSAASAGAPHSRPRFFWCAYSRGQRLERLKEAWSEAGLSIGSPGELPAVGAPGHWGRAGGDLHLPWDDSGQMLLSRSRRVDERPVWRTAARCSIQSGIPVVVDGLPRRMGKHRSEQIQAIGNSIVPQLAATFIQSSLLAVFG